MEGSVKKVFGALRWAAVPLAVLAISLFLTVLAYSYVKQTVEAETETRFTDTVQATKTAIERRTSANVDAILGARGLLLSSDRVTRREWSEYVASLGAEERFPGLQALGYAERVSPGAKSETRFPVTFVAPESLANRELLGEDLYAQSIDRAVMNRARDTGSAAMTGKTYVLSGDASVGELSSDPGFLVYLPLYAGERIPESMARRRASIKGFVVGAFLVEGANGVFGDVATTQSVPAVDFEVYDGKSLDSDQVFYDYDGTIRGGDGDRNELFTTVRHIKPAGHDLSLYFATRPAFEENFQSNLASLVLASGLAVSLLLVGITWMLVTSRNRVERASRNLEAANRELEATNRELESFSYSVSHDLRAPLRSIDGFSQILLEDYSDSLDEDGADYLGRVRAASQRMGQLIDDLLTLSRTARLLMRREVLDLSELAESVASELRGRDPDRDVEFVIAEKLVVSGDARLLRVALENLLANAWKFTSRTEDARIEFGGVRRGKSSGGTVYFVSDNGAGFDMSYAGKLFGAFQRLHPPEEFEGTGIGLATVQRVIRRHGGDVWAEGEVGRGATFYFTLTGGVRPSPDPPRKTGDEGARQPRAPV